MQLSVTNITLDFRLSLHSFDLINIICEVSLSFLYFLGLLSFVFIEVAFS